MTSNSVLFDFLSKMDKGVFIDYENILLFYIPLTSMVSQWKSLSSAAFWCFWQTHQSQLEDMWFKINH